MKDKWSWLDRPITWRTDLKVTAWLMLLYAIVYGAWAVYTFWDEILEKLDTLTALVKAKLNRGEE